MTDNTMTIQTQTLTTDQALQLLADFRRRKVLQTVREQNGGTVSVDALAVEFTGPDSSSTSGVTPHTDCSYVALIHNHLPQLAEYDVIAWDRENGTVSEGPAFDTVGPVLGLLERHTADLPTGYLSEGN